MKLIFKVKTFFSQKGNWLRLLAAILLSFAFTNITIQFLLRFLIFSWLRVFVVTTLLIFLYIPLNLMIIKKIEKNVTRSPKSQILLRLGLSLGAAIIFYLWMPVKITGNLLVLNQGPVLLYRISRLGNITSFLVTVVSLIFLMLQSISKKMGGKILWSSIAELFFLIIFLIGSLIYQDYGISSDEPNERISGLVTAQYFADFIEEELPDMNPYLPKLSAYRYRYYGVAFQFPLAVIEKNTLLKDQSIWHFRHLANFLFFYAGVLAFFHLAAEFFEDGRYGFLGSILLVLSPRIFAHAFFNPKDTIFLAAFTIALYYCTRFWQKPDYKRGIIAGLACAYAANVRLIAIALILISVGLFIIDRFSQKSKPRWPSLVSLLGTFILCYFLFWPASWQSPLHYLQNALLIFSDYVYWNFRVMYMGEFIRGAAVPWHYLPIWMGMTIPLAYILFFFIGTIVILNTSFKSGLKLFTNHKIRTRLIFLCLFLIPPLLAISLGSTLYNGWRHFQFVYTPFLLICLAGIQFSVTLYSQDTGLDVKKGIHSALLLLLGVNILTTAFWMIQYHPYQHVYFNPIGDLLGKENFERDYWRVSMKKGLEYLLEKDPGEAINICTEDQFADPSFLEILSNEERSRIHIITEESDFPACDFAINTYRTPDMFTCSVNFLTISADGLPILSISRCQDE